MGTIISSSQIQPVERDTPSPLLSQQDCLHLYYYMCLSRAFEQRAINLYRQGRLVGPLYTGIGHEAVSVGSAYALDNDDVIAPMHRDMGARFVRGITPKDVYAQYMGRVTGPSRGKDGNHHIGSRAHRMIGLVSHLGLLIPTAVGVALASKITGQGYVALTYIGDGGSSNGDFHEGLNFAAVRKLPFVLIVENNQFAFSTPTSNQYACKDLADRAIGYDIPGVTVDGNDVVAVYEACKHAIDRARAGDGPTLIEAVTLRIRGHSEADRAEYVPEELLEEWKKKDPVDRFGTQLRECGILTESMQAETDERITREIDEAVEFAEQSPWPEPEDTLTGVYAE